MIPLLASIAGTKLTEDEKRWLEETRPAGIIFFARNIAGKEQLRGLCDDIKNIVDSDEVILAIDQEGGRVRRLAEPDFLPYAAQVVLGRSGAEACRLHAGLISRDLRQSGLNFDCAPVLDLYFAEANSVIGERSLGSDEKKVAELGRVLLETFAQNAVCPCMKHLPGHGRALVDSHFGLPVLRQSLQELERDFFPFAANRDAPAGMTAHIVVSAVDEKYPVTVSKKAIEYLLRGHIGFDGLLISDAIEMKALSGSIAEKGAAVWAAGCDLVCYCAGKMADLRALSGVCPPLGDKTAERLQKVWQIVKSKPKPRQYDRRRYDELVGQTEQYCQNADATTALL